MSLLLKNIDQEGNAVAENVTWEQLSNWPVHQRLRQYQDLIKDGFCDWLSDISITRLLELARNGRPVGLIDALVWSRFNNALHPPCQPGQRCPPPPDVPTALKHFREDVRVMNEGDKRTRSNSQPMIFLLPVHANGNHWTLAAHVKGSDHCTYMDSLNPDRLPSPVYQNAIAIWSETISGRRLPLQFLSDIDRQPDEHSCGVHLVLNARYCIERRAAIRTAGPLDYVALRCSMWNEIAEYEASMIRSANQARRLPSLSQNSDNDVMVIDERPNAASAKDEPSTSDTTLPAVPRPSSSRRRRLSSTAIDFVTPSKTARADDADANGLQQPVATTTTTTPSRPAPSTPGSFVDIIGFTQRTSTQRSQTQHPAWDFPPAPASSFDLVPLAGVPGYDRFRAFLTSVGIHDTSLPMDLAMHCIFEWTVKDICEQREDIIIVPMQRFSKCHDQVVPFHYPAADYISAFVVPVLLNDAHFVIAVSKAAKGKHGFQILVMAPFYLSISAKLRTFFRTIAEYLFNVRGVTVTAAKDGVEILYVEEHLTSAYYCHVVDCIGKGTMPLDASSAVSPSVSKSTENAPPSTSALHPDRAASRLANVVSGLQIRAPSAIDTDGGDNPDVSFDYYPASWTGPKDLPGMIDDVPTEPTTDNTPAWMESPGVRLFLQYLNVVGVSQDASVEVMAPHIASWIEDLTTSLATDIVYLRMQFFQPRGVNNIDHFSMDGKRKGLLRLKYLAPIVFDNSRLCFALFTSQLRCILYAPWSLPISNELRTFLRSIGRLVYGSTKEIKCSAARRDVDLRHVDDEHINAYHFHLTHAIISGIHPLLDDKGFPAATKKQRAHVQPSANDAADEQQQHRSQQSSRRRKTTQEKSQRSLRSSQMRLADKLKNTAARRLSRAERKTKKRLPMYKRAMIGKPLPQYFYLGRLGDKVCPHCGALFFPCETFKCCLNGGLKLPEFDIEKYPEPLRSLYLGTHPKAEHFKQNARTYNNFMAFASTVMPPRKDLSKHGVPVVTVHGRMHHHQSHAFPPSNTNERAFAQYYFYDTAEATAKRSMSSFGADLDKDLLQELDAMMRNSDFCKAYMMAFEVFRQEAKTTDIHMAILSSRTKEARQVVDMRNTHPGRLGVPKLKDCLAVVYREGQLQDLNQEQYVLVNRQIQGKLTAAHNTIPFHNPDRLALCYPLIFPNGERFYDRGSRLTHPHVYKRQKRSNEDLPDADADDEEVIESEDDDDQLAAHTRVRRTASFRDVAIYHLQHRRTDRRHFMFEFRHLGQQLLIDFFLGVERGRLTFLIKNHDKVRLALRTDALTYLQKRFKDESVKIGRHIPLPASFTGGPRYQAHLFHNCSALFSALGRPQFFITFTGNPNWPEIKESLREVDRPAGKKSSGRESKRTKKNGNDDDDDGDKGTKAQSAFDIALVTVRVFQAKREQLMREIKDGALGTPVAWAYTIEFQKRGMPHMHLLLRTDLEITCPEEFDDWISASIPEEPEEDDVDYDAKRRYLDLVKRNLVHGPCEVAGEPWPCRTNKSKQNKNNKCDKWFPKDFREQSEFTEHGYVEPKRPDDGRTVEFNHGRRVATNQHIVAHNPYFIARFGAHINVEIINCGQAAIIYIFKYINKGNDQAVLELRTKLIAEAKAQGLTLIDIDECAEYEQLRFMSSCEAAFRLMGYKPSEMSHTVVELPVHEEDKEWVALEEGNEEEALRKDKLRQNTSQLTAYFALCAYDPSAHNLAYVDVPLSYSWNRQRFVWLPRRRTDPIVSRIQWVSISQQERYAIRVLLYNRRGVTSFQDLFTVNNTVHPTAFAAAVATGLMADETEWSEAMREAVRFQLPASARRTFAMILTHATSTDFLALWETYKPYLTNQDRHKSPEVMEQHALAHIASILKHAGKALSDFNLPDPDEKLIKQEEADDRKEEADKAFKEAYAKMNPEQRQLTDAFLDCVAKPKTEKGKCIFVQASGGCGKTLTANAIINACEVRGHSIVVTAATGIAAVQLSGGRTAHSAFKLSIGGKAKDIMSSIQGHLSEGTALQKIHGIIIDEAVMQSKSVLEAINHLLVGVALPEHQRMPFGGVAVLLCGDWKQLLPVVPNASERQLIASTIRESSLWKEFRQMSLRTNMRADPGQKAFADWLEEIGSGSKQVKAADDEECVLIPPGMIAQSADDVINWVYKADLLQNPKELANVAILTVQNKRTMELNDRIMGMLPNQDVHTLLGSNTVIVDQDQSPDIPVPQPESLVDILPSGFPPTKLILKTGCIIMLLRNLDVKNGLCNGTRLVLKEVCKNRLLCCGRIGSDDKEDVLIPRIDLEYEDELRQLRFRRRQFPVRPAFSMTINKAQGQTFSKVGIILYDPVFAHGHLYVALSRARNAASIRIATPGHNAVRRIGGNLSDVYVRNVVYKEVLPDSS